MVTVFLLATVSLSLVSNIAGILFADRNFYGVIRVRELMPRGSNEPAYAMSHGVTVHGLQFIKPELRAVPTTYYIRGGGAGLALLGNLLTIIGPGYYGVVVGYAVISLGLGFARPE